MSGKHTTLSPTLLKVLEITKVGVPVSPSQINDYIGKGNYAAKHVLYLKILDYDFSVVKSGRNVVSYTLIKEPTNAAQLVADAKKRMSKGVSTKIETAKPKTKAAKPKAVVDTAAIKAKNLETLKTVAANRKKAAKRVRVIDEVSDTFGTTGEIDPYFSVDNDWDSIEGLDLSKLL